MSGDHTAARSVFRGVAGCRIDIPDGRVTVEGTDGPDATLDIRALDGSAIAEDVVAERTQDGILTIRLTDPEPTRSRWLRAERRPRPAIHVRSPRTAWVSIETVGAGIAVSGYRGGQEATTVTGDTTIDQAEGSITVRSVSGSISVAGGSLTLQAATTSGRVRVDARELDSLQLRSVSGRVDVAGRLAADRDHRIETLSGDVRVTTSDGLRLDARTISGRLIAEGEARRASPGGTSELVAGDGSAMVHVTTVSGDIRLSSNGTQPVGSAADDPMLDALEALARGDISVEEADRRLEVLHG